MVLYFSDNKKTEHKRKGVFYEETLPENAVIFGSTTLKKYSGGPADYMKIGAKRYHIDEPVNERDVIGYIPVVAERYPSTTSDTTEQTKNKYGYIQLKEGFPFLLYLLSILLLLILFVLLVHGVGGNGIFKKNVVLPDKKHELPIEAFENKEITKEPEKIQDPALTPAPTKEPEKEEKNTPVAVLPMDPVVVPGNKVVTKPVSVIVPTVTPSTEPEKKEEKADSKDNSEKNTESASTAAPTATATPAPKSSATPASPNPSTTPASSASPTPSETPHVHNYVVDEKEPTCTEPGYYKKYCKDCGYVVADHTYTPMGHTLEAAGISNMTYPDGGDKVYVCTTCLNKKTEHCEAVPGMYDEAGKLMYTYDELEKLFHWDLSIHNAKYYSDNNAELSSGKILKLPDWEYLTKKAETSGNNAILMNGEFHNSATCAFNESTFANIIFPEDIPYLDVSWFGYLKNLQTLEIPDSVKEYICSNGNSIMTESLKYLKFSANADINHNTRFSYNNKNLETIIFPEGIKTIDNDDGTPIFYGTKIKEIQFPSTLSKLNCKILRDAPVKELTIPAGVELNSTSGNVIYFLYELKKLTLMNVKGNFPDGASLIYNCPLLETLVIQGDYGISNCFITGCNNLKTVIFSGNISYINENAFAGCALKDVYYIGNDEASKQVIANAANGPFANATIHYMNEEVTTQSIISEFPVAVEETPLPSEEPLPVTEEKIDTNINEETKLSRSVSDGNAN